ncbi:MAG: tyrosine-type recombinase/integrase [Planctomycetota bacterium]|nr:tyrosine-type recombinase/integrase [Planctomycetota bacterium]
MDDDDAGQPALPTVCYSASAPTGLSTNDTQSNAVCPPQLVTHRERLAWEEFIFGVGPLTRIVYTRAVRRFVEHLESLGLSVASATPRHVAMYVESLHAKPGHGHHSQRPPRTMAIRTRKQHLAAIRHFYHQLVQRHAAIINPAASVRSPRLIVERGETRAIRSEQIRHTLAVIDSTTLIGQRDHAIITVLSLTAARVGAVAKLTRGNVRLDAASLRPRDEMLILEEKHAKRRQLPLSGELRSVLFQWLQRLGSGSVDDPLFPSLSPHRSITRGLSADDILRMVRRRLRGAGFPASGISCHSFRAGAATALLESGLELTRVQDLLGHADPRTTRMYDARSRQVQSETMERLTRLFAG